MTGRSILRYAFVLAVKDLTVEFRRAHEFLSIVAFALTSTLVSSFAWRGSINIDPRVVSATLWIVIYFSTILALTTSFAREVDRGTIEGLRSLPCPAYIVLLGKVLYGGVIILIILLATLFSSIIFLNIGFEVIPFLMAVFVVGVLDLALVGSVVSALVMYSEGKNLLLSFLFFPVSVPILLPGIQAAAKIMYGMGIISIVPELRLLTAFMLTVSVASMILFSHVFLE